MITTDPDNLNYPSHIEYPKHMNKPRIIVALPAYHRSTLEHVFFQLAQENKTVSSLSRAKRRIICMSQVLSGFLFGIPLNQTIRVPQPIKTSVQPALAGGTILFHLHGNLTRCIHRHGRDDIATAYRFKGAEAYISIRHY